MRTTKKLPFPRADDDGTQLGIDLNIPKNINLVKKILRERSRTPHGYTFADWCQEILLVIWRRNHQPSAFDPRKSSIETYITIVAKSVSLKSERKYFTRMPTIFYCNPLAESDYGHAELSYEPDYEFDPYENLDISVDKFLKGKL